MAVGGDALEVTARVPAGFVGHTNSWDSVNHEAHIWGTSRSLSQKMSPEYQFPQLRKGGYNGLWLSVNRVDFDNRVRQFSWLTRQSGPN